MRSDTLMIKRHKSLAIALLSVLIAMAGFHMDLARAQDSSAIKNSSPL